MSNYIKMFIVLVFGVACFGFIWRYAFSTTEQDNQIQGLQESLQTALVMNQDYSARTKKDFRVDKKAFEADFLKLIVKNKNFTNNQQVEAKKTKVEFKYLPSKVDSDDNAISAVKVKMSVNGKLYQATYAIESKE